MPSVKRIVCLANSRKMSGRCVAGIDYAAPAAKAWIRPVSDREHQEVSEIERQYADGTDPRLLDIIDIPLLIPKPHLYQSENWLIDPQNYWVKVGTFAVADLSRLAGPVDDLWLNGDSSYNGLNDRIELEGAKALRNSLRLIVLNKATLVVAKSSGLFSKRSVQARFTYGGTPYWLRVTDPTVTRRYLSRDDGNYALGKCAVSISLGEPLNGYVYKLVAAIVDLP